MHGLNLGWLLIFLGRCLWLFLTNLLAFLNIFSRPRPLCPLLLFLHFLQVLLWDFLNTIHLLQRTTILIGAIKNTKLFFDICLILFSQNDILKILSTVPFNKFAATGASALATIGPKKPLLCLLVVLICFPLRFKGLLIFQYLAPKLKYPFLILGVGGIIFSRAFCQFFRI